MSTLLGRLGWAVAGLLILALPPLSAEEAPAKIPEPGDRVMVLLKEGNKAISGILVAANEKTVSVQTTTKTEELSREQIQFMRGLESKTKPVEDEEEGPNVRASKPQPPPASSNTAKPAARAQAEEGAKEGNKLLDLLKGGPIREPEKPAAAAEPKDLKLEGSAWTHACRFFEAQQYFNSVTVLRKIVNSGNVEEIKKAEAGAQERFKRPLADVIVLCYTKAKCKNCNGDGMQECKSCSGQGYSSRLFSIAPENQGFIKPGTRERGDLLMGVKESVGEKTYHRIALCGVCRGHGYEPCLHCRGTGAEFAKPTPYERERYADYLTALADSCLTTSESTFGDTQRDAPQDYYLRNGSMLRSMMTQVSLRDSISKVKSDIMRLLRAKTYYEEAMRADPGLSLRNYSKDYDQVILKIVLRGTNLVGELNERFQVYAQNRTERALDEAMYCNDPKIPKLDAKKIVGDE